VKPTILAKLANLVERHEEVAALLSDPGTIADQARFRDLSREYARLEPVVRDYQAWQRAEADTAAAREMAGDADPELAAMAEDELLQAGERVEALETKLKKHLVPRDPLDEANIFLEIRAGTGGDEAAIFAGDLFRMYSRYAEAQGWQVEVLSENEGEHGGYKEIISRLVGRGAYSRLKFESGAHRVQRVPETESQGRIHTSAATVAVLPEAEEVEVAIDDNDLRIDTFRASGPGGQSVNTMDSAVRITHVPTGLVVSMQDEKSQLKNKAKALRVLRSRLLQIEQDKAAAEAADLRQSQVATGDRSEKIRTYNVKENRVTDHRLGLTLYRLEEFLDGDLNELLQALSTHHRTQALAQA